MAEEEAAVSKSSVTTVENAAVAASNTLETQTSGEATIESISQGGTESTCNNIPNGGGEASAPDHEKSLDFAAELAEKGAAALKEGDYAEAVECFSRALEIRVTHFGELSPECLHAYYQYGRALLYKAQEEADPLGAVPKKDGEPDKVELPKNATNAESSTASVSSGAEADGKSESKVQEEAADGGGDEESDDEDLAEGDEDESDLDLAWKMLDVARAITEKHSNDTMDQVDVLSALAEVALEREDIETSLSDYLKALSILEQLVEPDSRHIAELNFRICLCLEIGSKPQEAIPFCQKALSTCKMRLERLMNEVKNTSESSYSAAVTELEEVAQQSSNGLQSCKSATDKEAEIETLTGLSTDLEKKLEDLQQLASNPKSILSDLLGMAATKFKGSDQNPSAAAMDSSQMGTATSSGGFDSPTVSTAHTNGGAPVTHLGVVGRGVKRVLMNTGTAESSPSKKPELDSSEGKEDGNSN